MAKVGKPHLMRPFDVNYSGCLGYYLLTPPSPCYYPDQEEHTPCQTIIFVLTIWPFRQFFLSIFSIDFFKSMTAILTLDHKRKKHNPQKKRFNKCAIYCTQPVIVQNYSWASDVLVAWSNLALPWPRYIVIRFDELKGSTVTNALLVSKAFHAILSAIGDGTVWYRGP